MSKSISWKHSINQPVKFVTKSRRSSNSSRACIRSLPSGWWAGSYCNVSIHLIKQSSAVWNEFFFQDIVVRTFKNYLFFCIFTLKTLIISVAPLLALWYQLRPRCWYVKNSSCKVVPRNLEIPEIGLNCVIKVPHVTGSQSFRIELSDANFECRKSHLRMVLS